MCFGMRLLGIADYEVRFSARTKSISTDAMLAKEQVCDAQKCTSHN